MQSIHFKNLAFAVIAILISVYLIWTSFNFSFDSSFLLRMMSILMGLLSIAYFVKVSKSKNKDVIILENNQTPKKYSFDAISVFTMVIILMILFKIFGVFISLFVFVYLGQVYIAKKHKNIYLYVAIGLSLVVFYLFFGFLGIALPESYFDFDHFFKFN